MTKQQLIRDERGATIVETAFALPALIVLLWGMVQLGLVYRANSGIQHSLGEGARLATLYPTPTDTVIEATMESAVYGIGPGDFTTTVTDVPASGYKDLRVTYTQPTNLLLFPGPTITVNKSKRVWIAGSGTAGSGGGGSGAGTGGTPASPPPIDPTPPPTPTPTPEPTPTPTPTPETTPPPVTTPTPTPTPPKENGNGNNTVCKKQNGKAC